MGRAAAQEVAQLVFYFSTGRTSRKAKNLAKNDRCVVCNERADEAVIVEGTAKEVTDAKLIKRLGGPYHAKYKPWKLDPEMGPIYAVTPHVVFGMYEKKFSTSATRWDFGTPETPAHSFTLGTRRLHRYLNRPSTCP